jgi:diadenosine tetraphosphate (Ap4A) HIT family hydrolase
MTTLRDTDPALICRVPSGRVCLCNLQFLRGYCILESDPVVESINALNLVQQAQFMLDMVLVGEALLEVTDAYRVNYAMLSNTRPILHAHIVPRYLDEPEDLRKLPPWFYPNLDDPAVQIDYERDRLLMASLAQIIQNRLATR